MLDFDRVIGRLDDFTTRSGLLAPEVEHGLRSKGPEKIEQKS